MSAANLLTQEEVEALTGAKQAAKQASILDEHGIYYIRRVDGKIITTWHHVNHPCSAKTDTPQTGHLPAITGNECHGNVPLMEFLKDNFQRYVMAERDILDGAVKYSYRAMAAPASSGCYFLIVNNEVVYVGKAKYIWHRLRAHDQDEEKDFSHCFWIETVCEHVAEYVEGFYIQLLNPSLNIRIPATCDVTDKILRGIAV